MSTIKILWVDDEIDLLKPHILFLEKKEYSVTTCSNGSDALDLVPNGNFDIVFLDENMPGLSGLDVLSAIKELKPTLPIVMITKSEEEQIMEEAIGGNISDYLIKPVNPNQILLSLKKNLDHTRLIAEKTTADYQQEFRNIAMEMMDVDSYDEWSDFYKKLIHWELALDAIDEPAMRAILDSQKQEANAKFFKFIVNNYKSWFDANEDKPVLPFELFKKHVVPNLQNNEKTLFIVIDNLRYDQWRIIEPIITKYYKVSEEHMFYSMLPTATQYARNAIFSGLTPLEMAKQYPMYWKNDTDEGGKNLYENEFLMGQLARLKLDIKHQYHKITNLKNGQKLADNFNTQKDNDLTVVVYNFVDMLSHSKTDMQVIKELASDDKGYRLLTKSWFENSPLLAIIQQAQTLGMKLIITTDHGTINATRPTKIVGNKDISSNLRYKMGRSLSYNEKDVLTANNPEEIGLPSININSKFVFAKEDYFFAYPNNYNYYVNYYKNTYQHGGISLEEMLIPCIKLEPRK